MAAAAAAEAKQPSAHERVLTVFPDLDGIKLTTQILLDNFSDFVTQTESKPQHVQPLPMLTDQTFQKWLADFCSSFGDEWFKNAPHICKQVPWPLPASALSRSHLVEQLEPPVWSSTIGKLDRWTT